MFIRSPIRLKGLPTLGQPSFCLRPSSLRLPSLFWLIVGLVSRHPAYGVNQAAIAYNPTSGSSCHCRIKQHGYYYAISEASVALAFSFVLLFPKVFPRCERLVLSFVSFEFKVPFIGVLSVPRNFVSFYVIAWWKFMFRDSVTNLVFKSVWLGCVRNSMKSVLVSTSVLVFTSLCRTNFYVCVSNLVLTSLWRICFHFFVTKLISSVWRILCSCLCDNWAFYVCVTLVSISEWRAYVWKCVSEGPRWVYITIPTGRKGAGRGGGQKCPSWH